MSDAPESKKAPIDLAAEELSAVFAKYDLGGSFIVCDPKQSSARLFIEPSWSCARRREGGPGWLLATLDDAKALATSRLFETMGQRFYAWTVGIAELDKQFEARLKVIQDAIILPIKGGR